MAEDRIDGGWMSRLPPDVRATIEGMRAEPEFPQKLAAYAESLREQCRGAQRMAQEVALHAWSVAGDDVKARQAVEWAIRERVPDYHTWLLRDHERNAAYERAIWRFVKPSRTVLEIGTGSGLLAMLAARAGARHVYTCESEPLLAAVARENIRRNGLEGRITLIECDSHELTVGRDIPDRADVLMTELFDSRLLGENVLPAVEDARARLVRPGGAILPSRASAIGALVGGPVWVDSWRVDTACSFDVSALNRIAPLTVPRPVSVFSGDDTLSDPIPLFDFDLAAGDRFPPESKVIDVAVRRTGRADGILQWIALWFDDDIRYENGPGTESHWTPMLHLFPRPLVVTAGDVMKLSIEHDRRSIMVSPAEG